MSDDLAGSFEQKLDRETLIKRGASAGVAFGLAPYIATSKAFKSARTVKIGWVAPLTGPLASFGEANKYTVGVMQKLFGKGISVGKNTFPVEILLKDSQSNANRGATVAQSLILDDNVDLMLVSSTPITTNPVSDVCEANGMPCIVTDVPWQAWFFGRKGNPAKPFKWTWHFFWGLEDIIAVFLDMWSQVQTNKVVGALYPNDPDGNAWADKKLGFPPVVKKAGYTTDRPRAVPRAERRLLEPDRGVQEGGGPDRHGRADPARLRHVLEAGARSRASTRRSRRSAARSSSRSTVEALGKNGVGHGEPRCGGSPGSPVSSSSLTGQTAAQHAATWTRADRQAVDAADRLFACAVRGRGGRAQRGRRTSTTRTSIVAAIKATNLNTIVGHITWHSGACKPGRQHRRRRKLAGGQWRQGQEVQVRAGRRVSNKRVSGSQARGKARCRSSIARASGSACRPWSSSTASRSRSARSRRSPTSRSTSPTARRSESWARTGPARRRS